jgi:DNA repair ATPase RecN
LLQKRCAENVVFSLLRRLWRRAGRIKEAWMSDVNFTNLHRRVREQMTDAMQELEKLRVKNEEGQSSVKKILEGLEKFKSKFDVELSTLEECAEWEKFTMAFFGETNAGKSTIIESLRILFNDEERLQRILHTEKELQEQKQVLSEHADAVRDNITRICEEYAQAIVVISGEILALRAVMDAESVSRAKRKLILYALAGFIVGACTASGAVIYYNGLL